MSVKIFKAVWFLSMLGVLVNLLYTYAGLPVDVVINENGGSFISIGKDNYFYLAATLIAVINALVFVVNNLYRGDADFRTWFYGLVICLNFFFVVALNFISLYNSGDEFDYSRIEYLIIGSTGLFVVWALGWPVYSLYRKIYIKESV
ncbi:MAG TPA: hypothetical protein VK589_16865 [Chryseolinea sp.]|nr:hypothetical protein [Chryseolinea sp.]